MPFGGGVPFPLISSGSGWDDTYDNGDKYQKPHVLVAKLFTRFIIYRKISGPYAISWLECRQTNMFDAKTVILY